MQNFSSNLVSDRFMILKRLDIFILIFCLLFCFSVIEIDAQKRATKKTSTKKKLQKRPKIISGGVMNGKAVELVKPEFPKSAAFVNVKGFVSIQVLIDEKGNVTSAKATKGHPLLIPASLKAALKSKFSPTLISNTPVQVTGIIVHNYISNKMNWLEIGYNFDDKNDFYQALPPDFVDEKIMLIQAGNLGDVEKTEIFHSVENLIKSKISNDEKQLWLFSLGRNLKELSLNHWDAEQKKTLFERIDAQLLYVPNEVSLNLVRKVNKLNTQKFNEFNTNLVDLIEKLYALGN